MTCAVLAFGVVSCKKEGCTDPTATNYDKKATKDDGSCETGSAPNTEDQTYVPKFAGTFGTLVAIKSISSTSTPIGEVETSVGTAVAVFSEDSGSTFMKAGTVKVNSQSLSLQNNNSYVYMIGATNPTGISYSNLVEWDATGSDWPAFSTSTNQGFSTIGSISSGNASSSSNYTLTATQVVDADSVLFAVYGQGGSVLKILPAGTTSHTFSSSEISSVGSGSGMAQVVGLKYDVKSINGKTYYLINETVRTKSINVQ